MLKTACPKCTARQLYRDSDFDGCSAIRCLTCGNTACYLNPDGSRQQQAEPLRSTLDWLLTEYGMRAARLAAREREGAYGPWQ